MKTKMILKKGIVFLFAIMMALTGIFSLGVMAASGLEGAYISPKSKMGLEFANNFDRSVSKSQVSVPNFMADSDTNSEEPNKSFNAQQVAAGNSDAGAKWRGFAAYAKNHDPEDFWVRYKDVTTVGGKSVDLKIEVTDWKTQKVNLPTGVPLVYEFDDSFNVISKQYLGDPSVIAAKINKVAAQGKKQ